MVDQIILQNSQTNHFHSSFYSIFLLRCDKVTKALISASHGESIRFNLARVYYFTHTTRGPRDSPNLPELDKGILASTVPNKAQPLRVRPSCAWRLSSIEDISKFPTHSSTRGPAKPPCIALGHVYGTGPQWLSQRR